MIPVTDILAAFEDVDPDARCALPTVGVLAANEATMDNLDKILAFVAEFEDEITVDGMCEALAMLREDLADQCLYDEEHLAKHVASRLFVVPDYIPED